MSTASSPASSSTRPLRHARSAPHARTLVAPPVHEPSGEAPPRPAPPRPTPPPQGHTLRLLSLPDFLDLTLGKVVRLRQKLSSAATAVKSLFGQQDQDQDEAVNKLEALKGRLQEVKDLFRNEKTTEFVIVTIPTVLSISESGRLLHSLRAEKVPVARLVVNQLLRKAGGGDVSELKEALAKREAELGKLLEGAGGISEEERKGAVAALGEIREAREALLKALQSDVSFCSLKRKARQRGRASASSEGRLSPLPAPALPPRRTAARSDALGPRLFSHPSHLRRTRRRRWSSSRRTRGSRGSGG